MNWGTEAHYSWTWLQWMRQIVNEDGAHTTGVLYHLGRGLAGWDEDNARDRHSVGDPNRIQPGEFVDYAVSMMSRAARQAITEALDAAIAAGVNDPMSWPSRPGTDKQQWDTSRHIIATVLQAWITLWTDLTRLRDKVNGTSVDDVRDQWTALADQAAQTVTGAAAAALAQRR